MLVLSRKPDQQIMVGKDILITILEIAGNRVKVGIAAPISQHVLRGELVPQRSLPAKERRA